VVIESFSNSNATKTTHRRKKESDQLCQSKKSLILQLGEKSHAIALAKQRAEALRIEQSSAMMGQLAEFKDSQRLLGV
jgi:hypothetical protein